MEMIWVQHSPVPYTLPGPPPRHPQTGPTHCSSSEEPQKGQKSPPRLHSSQDVNVGIQQSRHGCRDPFHLSLHGTQDAPHRVSCSSAIVVGPHDSSAACPGFHGRGLE